MANEKFSLPKLSDFLDNHLIWVLGLTPFVIAAMNIMAISYGDPQVFAYILQNLDLVSLILGVTLPLIPVAIVWLLVAWLNQRYAIPKANRPEVPLTTLQIGSAILVLAALAIQVMYLVAVAIPLMFIISHQRWTRYRNKRSQVRYGVDVKPRPIRLVGYQSVAIFITVTFIQQFLGAALWIPNEAIVLKNSKAVSGQVLATDKEWTTFLIRGKGVRIVHSGDVLSREPCYADTSVMGRTLGMLLSQRLLHTSQPRCP